MSFFQSQRSRWEVHRTAIRCSEGHITYGELEDRVGRAAGWLLQRGLRKGDTLALQLPRSLAFVEVHLAALALGITTLPLNTSYTAAELQFYLSDSAAHTACVLDERVPELSHLAVHCIPAGALRSALDASNAVALPVSLPDDTVAVLLYTSGTTGRAKGALIRHSNIEAAVSALDSAWGWTQEDVLLHALPLFHVHGLFVAQHGALRAGATAVWMDAFDATAALHHMKHDHITVFMGVPTFYARLLTTLKVAIDLPEMRLFTSGSAPLPAADHQAFFERTGHRILERYGMTEVGIVLSNPLNGERRPGAVGFPLPGVRARVTDLKTGKPVDTNTVGEIRIAGPSVFDGYLGLPEKTAAALEDGWMHTGDLGFKDDDGYFHLVGRNSDMIISGGLNVYPKETEARLLEHPAVHEAAVVSAPDPDLGERVVATVVTNAGVSDQQLIAWCRHSLAGYKCPKAVHQATALPRNAMGKVQKSQLREAWARPAFRSGTLSDLDRIVQHNLAMALETEELALDPGALTAGVLRALQGDVGAHYLIAEVAGSVVGQCMITKEWSDWRNREVWWYQSVYIAPRWRRRGIFRAMHTHVLQRATQAGAAGLRLYVDRTNDRAMATYEAMGMNGDHYTLYELMVPPGA